MKVDSPRRCALRHAFVNVGLLPCPASYLQKLSDEWGAL